MLTSTLCMLFALSASLVESRSLLDVKHVHKLRIRQNENADGLFLLASTLQSGSSADGSVNGVSIPGQSKSAISTNNFINFCEGKTLTNGLQVQTGSCNGIPMGDIPSKQNMVSSIITFPLPASQDVEENTTFQISVQMINFVAGSFTNAQATYYSAPQELSGGKIVGHTHVTVQDMGPDLNPKTPMDPEKFVFFKGINDAGNGNGLLSATVPGGLPAGNYRACTMASASNHQLVLMPVAQRGAQDDCTKFTVVPAGTGNNNPGGNDSGGQEDPQLSSTSSFEAVEVSTSVSESTTLGSSDSSATLTSTSSASVIGTAASQVTLSQSTSPDLFPTQPPFANSSFSGASTTTRSKKSRKTRSRNLTTTQLANGNNPSPITTQLITSLQATPASPSPTTTTKRISNNGGRPRPRPNVGNLKATRPRKQIIRIIHRITIIRTIFVFRPSLGGLPPAVNKNGNGFAVGGQVFPNLPSACQAACGEQFNRCVKFGGPGFEREKCEVQRKECGAAADIATTQPAQTPVEVTATVTIPAPTDAAASSSLSLPGSVIGEETVSSEVELPPVSTVVDAPTIPTGVSDDESEDGAEPSEIAIPSSIEGGNNVDESTPSTTIALDPAAVAQCTPIFQTITVEKPAETVTVSVPASSTSTVALPTIISPPFSNSTVPRMRRFA